ncbi:MAG: four helix bundle protein [Bacteroidetes bacterium]|nr:four helix bundle protein [Bacteroidota bacterium]
MGFSRFEDILAWQKSKDLTLNLYRLFLGSRDFGFRDQIQRASVSIMNNIAEGFERQTNKEFRQFLYIAKGSCAEIKSMLYLALELSYLKMEEHDLLMNDTVEVSKILTGLIKSLEQLSPAH